MRGDTSPLIDFDVDLPDVPPAVAPPHSFSQPFPPTSYPLMDHGVEPLQVPRSGSAPGDMIQLATRQILDNQAALERAISKLDQAEVQLQRLRTQLHRRMDGLDGVIPQSLKHGHPDIRSLLSGEDRERLARAVTMPTSAIANAKNREPSPFSSGPSRPSMTSSSVGIRSDVDQPSADPRADAAPREVPEEPVSCSNPLPAITPVLEVAESIPASQTLASIPANRQLVGRKALPMAMHSVKRLPDPVSGITKKPRGRPRKNPSANSASAPSAPHPPQDESQASPDTATGSSAEMSDSSASRRRSARAHTRPDNYYSFADPSHPSYIPLIDQSVKTRRQTEKQLRAAEADVQLEKSDGNVRATGSAWPELPLRTAAGITIAVVCDICAGRCHLACAGLTIEECSFRDWICPDCTHVAVRGEAPLPIVEEADHVKCIRHDCILISQRNKRKYETAEEDEYTLERIIGRRRAPDWTASNRKFEYLLLWGGIDRSSGRAWGVEDATWEPRGNVFEIIKEEPLFVQACLREGLDPKTEGPKPILLEEAFVAWTEDGELQGDGWSKRIMAAAAALAESSKRKKRKGSDRVEPVSKE